MDGPWMEIHICIGICVSPFMVSITLVVELRSTPSCCSIIDNYITVYLDAYPNVFEVYFPLISSGGFVGLCNIDLRTRDFSNNKIVKFIQ